MPHGSKTEFPCLLGHPVNSWKWSDFCLVFASAYKLNFFLKFKDFNVWYNSRPQITQTAYLLSQGGLYRPIVDPARQATFLLQVFRLPSHGHFLHMIPIQGISFTTFKDNTPILDMKHNIYEFSLCLKILCIVFKRSLNIPEYICLLIGRVQHLYTIENVVENIAYYRFQLISVTLLSLF